jgi:ACS family D-galactonate transporter-like MFS transporter
MHVKQKTWYPWLVVGLLWGVALLNYLDRQMLSTMKSSIMGDIRELESAENFGRLMAVFLWIYGLVSPLSGLIADRISRKKLIIGSLGVWSGVTLLMGYAGTFEQLYVLRAVMGVSEAIYIPAGLALIADYHTGRTRSLAIGIHMTGLYLGQAMGGFGASVAERWSWHTTFHSFGLIGIIYSFLLVVFLFEKRVKEERLNNNRNLTNELESVKRSLVLLLGTLSFWIILFYFSAPSFPGWAIKNWLPTLYSDTLGIPMSKAGPLSTITIAASSFLGVISGGLLADRWIAINMRGRIYTGVIGLSLTIPALFLIGFGTGLVSIILGGVAFGFGFGMFDANNMPVLCQFVSPRHRAAGYGIMNMAGVFAGALATSWLGKSADTGTLGRDLSLLSIPVAASVILMLTVMKPQTDNKTED